MRPRSFADALLSLLLGAAVMFAACVPQPTLTEAEPELTCTPTASPPATSINQEEQAGGYRIVVPGLAAGEAPVVDPPPSPPPGFDALLADLESTIAAYPVDGDYAVAVTDLQSGHTISVNGRRPQRSACVVNLFAIIQSLRDVEAGIYPLSDAEGLIRETIWASNATTAMRLYALSGGGDATEGVRRVATLLHGVLGLPEIVIDHPPAYGGYSLGVSDDNLATAEAMNAALAALYRGELLNGEYTAWLLEALTRVKPGLNYLTANLPSSATVSHKNGFFWAPDGYVDNDTAIVRFQSGGVTYAYAITFMSEGVAEEYDDIWLGRDLVRKTWEYFTAAYR